MTDRYPVWGVTYTQGMDALLDAYNQGLKNTKESIKQLQKTGMKFPEVRRDLDQVIVILKKGGK